MHPVAPPPKAGIAFQDAETVSGEKRTGIVEFSKEGTASARNDKGEPLLRLMAFAKGDHWLAEARIPSTLGG